MSIEVKHASNGEETIRLIDSGLIPHIIIMDLQLPETNIDEIIRFIKKKYPDIYIIALSEMSTSEDVKNAINCGFNDFLAKPIRNETFTFKINKYL
jgi:CheY-like chemotaxis protein